MTILMYFHLGYKLTNTTQMSKQELTNRRIVAGLTVEQLQVKNTLHEYLGEKFRTQIDEAYIFMDKEKISALIKLYQKELLYSE